MASMTMSAIAARPTFLAGSGKVARSAPVAARAVRTFAVKAEGEEKESKAVAKIERNTDDLYLMGTSDQSLSYLDGSLPGDYAFDPLGMSDPEGAGGFVNPEWLAYSEVIHGRWAMLGVAGVAAPEILGKAGIIPESTGLVWFKSGMIPAQATGFEYWADPYTIFWVNVCLMNFAELRRSQDYYNPGYGSKQDLVGWEKMLGGSGEPAYPGEFFNLFGLGKDDMKTMRTKEIKNGRLAMMAFFGIMVQALATGEGPVQNIIDHINDPFGANLLVNFGKIGGGASPF